MAGGMDKKKYPIGPELYTLYEEFGIGVSASVHRALCVPLNEIVAVKILDFERHNSDLFEFKYNINMENDFILLDDGMPIGYKFDPTDYDALYYYLLPKLSGQHIKPWLVSNVDIYNYQPQDLPGFNAEASSFYFTPRELKFSKGSRPSRLTKDGKGFWKMTSKITKINDLSGLPVGRKNTLVYHLKSDDMNQKAYKTDYIMQEYVLEKSLGPLGSTLGGGEKVKDVVLCKIYLKKSSNEQDEQEEYDGVDNDPKTNRVVKRKRSITPQTEEIGEWSYMAEQLQSNLACKSLTMVPNKPPRFNDIWEFNLNQDNRQSIQQFQSIQLQLNNGPLETSDESQMFDEIPCSIQGNYQYVPPQLDFQPFNNPTGESSHDLYRQIHELQCGQELGCSSGVIDRRFDMFQLKNPSPLTAIPHQTILQATNQNLTTNHAYHLLLNQEAVDMEYGHRYRAQGNLDMGATESSLPPLLESFAPSDQWIQTCGRPLSLEDDTVEKLDLLDENDVVKKQTHANSHSNNGRLTKSKSF